MSAAVPLLPKSFPDQATAQRRTSETVNHILTFQNDDSRIQTAAEILAGVTPVNYAYPPGDVRRYGADPTGATDSTVALQNCANGGAGVMTFPVGGSFLVSAQISIPAGTVILGNDSTLNAASAWSITGWHLLNAQGSITVYELNFTVPAVARNTTWKAVNVDNSVQALPAKSEVIVRGCVLTNLDIGIYVDGGASQHVTYAEVSGCLITINTAGTGGGSSIRPTIGLNNCALAVIRDNPLLDASDRVNSVNNIYCIGSSKLTVENNYLLSGTVKCLSNPSFAVDTFTLQNNRLQGIPWVQCQVDTNPIKYVNVLHNRFDTPVTQAVDVACVIFSNLTNCATDSYEFVRCEGNYFTNVPASCYYINISATNSFGELHLSGNHYNDTSKGSAGTYAVVNFTIAGSAYRSLICSDESVYGNTHTESYLQQPAYSAGNLFATVLLSDIEEIGITGAKTGFVVKSCMLTVAGCTTAPTVTGKYSIVNGVATLTVPSTGVLTSNAATFGFTGLPAELVPLTANSQVSITAADNGAFTVATAQITAASSSIALSKNGSLSGWTNAGGKECLNFTISYPLG